MIATGKKELRKTVFGVPYSESQWEYGWDILREDGKYEFEFGDYLIYGLYQFVKHLLTLNFVFNIRDCSFDEKGHLGFLCW